MLNSPDVIPINEGAPKEAQALLKGDDPIYQLELLSAEGVTGAVYKFTYLSGKYTAPPGLGQHLPRADDRGGKLLVNFTGKWVKQPEECQPYALKVAHQETHMLSSTQTAYQVDAEAINLLALNGLFPEEAFGRPPRLFGFGLQEPNKLGSRTPYIISEYIGQGYGGQYLPLEDYLKIQPLLGEREALTIAARLVFVLQKAHQAGITHNDLEDGALQNTFWDPVAGKMRLIDWANSQNIQLTIDKRLSYSYDRKGVGELIFRLLTGQRLGDVKKQYLGHLPEQAWTKVPVPVRNIIQRSCGLSANGYDPFNPAATSEMLTDLGAAFKQVA